jgi:hypothetical protein
MNCLQFERALPDYLEGARTSEQQAHVSSCSTCSGLLADLDFISAQAAALREFDEPSPRVWNALEAQLRREGLIRQPARPSLRSFVVRWRTAWLVPALAALLIAAGIKLYQPARVGDNQPPARPVASAKSTPASSSSATASTAVSQEDKELLRTVASKPPAQVAAYRHDLDQANSFIRDAQEAVKSNRNDVYSQELLINAYEQKQMLYHLAVDQEEVVQGGDVQ